MTRQLSMFGDEGDAAAARQTFVEPAEVDPAWGAVAAALSPRIRLGTSSWSFPGWTGLVYAARKGKPESEQRLARLGLPAYAAHPLLRTVSHGRRHRGRREAERDVTGSLVPPGREPPRPPAVTAPPVAGPPRPCPPGRRPA